MTKVELYKSRVFVTIIHLFALGQFAYGLFYNKFEIQRSYKLETSINRRLVPDGVVQKAKFLTYWSLIESEFPQLTVHCPAFRSRGAHKN
ncbi:unnamed protein product [Ceratitis capitata]|uniref:(Mediterranean fruit fly) hypothetical protein n=1 Tax=Ceratitis capitata TaxID=7213 RepID=A0A811UL74_CERCA|nr:unnamed protein product [Ceratitis capitata]